MNFCVVVLNRFCILILGDYRLENYSLTIFPDPTNETVCATFSPVDDGLVEDTEYFQFNVRTQNGNDMVDNSTFRISILDDDGTLSNKSITNS